MPRKERKIKEQKKEAIKRAREPPSSPFTPSMASPHEKETKFTYEPIDEPEAKELKACFLCRMKIKENEDKIMLDCGCPFHKNHFDDWKSTHPDDICPRHVGTCNCCDELFVGESIKTKCCERLYKKSHLEKYMKENPSKLPCCENYFCFVCNEIIDFDLEPELAGLSCHHLAHSKCYYDWVGERKYICPVCKERRKDKCQYCHHEIGYGRYYASCVCDIRAHPDELAQRLLFVLFFFAISRLTKNDGRCPNCNNMHPNYCLLCDQMLMITEKANSIYLECCGSRYHKEHLDLYLNEKGQKCPRCLSALGPNYKISGGAGFIDGKYSIDLNKNLAMTKSAQCRYCSVEKCTFELECGHFCCIDCACKHGFNKTDSQRICHRCQPMICKVVEPWKLCIKCGTMCGDKNKMWQLRCCENFIHRECYNNCIDEMNNNDIDEEGCECCQKFKILECPKCHTMQRANKIYCEKYDSNDFVPPNNACHFCNIEFGKSNDINVILSKCFNDSKSYVHSSCLKKNHLTCQECYPHIQELKTLINGLRNRSACKTKNIPINFNTTTCVICGISGPNDLKQDVIFHFNLEIGHMGCCKQKVHHYCADKLIDPLINPECYVLQKFCKQPIRIDCPLCSGDFFHFAPYHMPEKRMDLQHLQGICRKMPDFPRYKDQHEDFLKKLFGHEHLPPKDQQTWADKYCAMLLDKKSSPKHSQLAMNETADGKYEFVWLTLQEMVERREKEEIARKRTFVEKDIVLDNERRKFMENFQCFLCKKGPIAKEYSLEQTNDVVDIKKVPKYEDTLDDDHLRLIDNCYENTGRTNCCSNLLHQHCEKQFKTENNYNEMDPVLCPKCDKLCDYSDRTDGEIVWAHYGHFMENF